jgi:sirohydrochlorin ferrochelatase
MTRRLSLSLEHDDEAAIAAFISPGTPDHAALLGWAAEHDMDDSRLRRSEAAVYRALLRAGVEAVRDRALEEGYRELAKWYAEPEQAYISKENRVLRKRYAEQVDRNIPA